MIRGRALSAVGATAALAALQSCPAKEALPQEAPSPTQEQAAVGARQDPASRIDAVLDHYHGPLRGKLEQVLVELRAEGQTEPTQVLLSLPDKMRVDHPDHGVDLLIDGVGWRCDGRKPAVRLEGEALATLQHLRQHLRAVVLAPLYEAKKIDRKGPGVVALILPQGETWRLQLDEKSLRLEELRGPAGAVRFESFLETGVTVLPEKVSLPGDRVLFVKFRANPTLLHPSLFADPALPLPDSTTEPRAPTHQRTLGDPNERPPRAVRQDIERRMFLVLPDPGDWKRRTAAIVRAGNALYAKGQTMGGLPSYRSADGKPQLVIPFRPDPRRGSQPFVRGPEDVVLHVPEHGAVVVAPPAGTWDDVMRRGLEEISTYLTEHDLDADGPLLAIPFLDAGVVPEADDLGKLRIRLEQRVRKRD